MLVGRGTAVVQSTIPTGPQVSPDTANTSTNNTADCFAGIEFNSSGVEWASNNSGTFNVGRGSWLDEGLSSEVWVERTIDSDSGDGLNWNDPGTGRHQLSTTRAFGCTDTSIGGGAVEATVTFDFYDAASGGNLLASEQNVISALKEL